ncbi:hypothetical protein Gogos_011065 [Gossypium gossypioides]|uniref:Methyltransferase type 11 domain-containing protein n=1 Tax=Gossypium gossypioides TaxID=34282 RepID=A0A7J9BN67_GOSGO|nr:hypothetical protein [Gossypium gossypioides]
MAIAPPSLHKYLYAKYPCVSHNFRFRHSLRFSCRPFRFTARASSAVSWETDLSIQKNQTEETDLFSCPVCYEPLIRKGPPGLNLAAIYRSGFKCKQCDKSYSSKDTYLDLTVTAGLRDYTEVKPAGTELFRSPFVSFVYERGWRQNFNRRGFPGPDEEFRMAQEYFKPVEGGILVDVSCGSGLFSRKFVKSGTYSGVIALDFSENMLRQCNDFIEQDASILASNIALVRADVSRLPFSSGSVDAVHAGAALHCWPSPLNAVSILSQYVLCHKLELELDSKFEVAEISRILRSGGVFVGSTFLRYTSSTPRIIRPFREVQANSFGFLFNFIPNIYATPTLFLQVSISDTRVLVFFLEDSAKLQLPYGGRDRSLVYILRSYQLYKKYSTIFHHVFGSEALKQDSGSDHFNVYIFNAPPIMIRND